MTESSTATGRSRAKDVLRKFIPNVLLQQRGIVLRLGIGAGRIYTFLWLSDRFGMRSRNQRLAPASARSFLFVCYGNIMRSALAEHLMRKEALETAPQQSEHLQILSAGLHAIDGKEAHPWAQEAAMQLGVSLADHRAKPLTMEMVGQADCILVMDFQNKAELMMLYPEAAEKVYMLSAYGEGPWKYREIPDPYHQDLERTFACGQQLQICVKNLLSATVLAGNGSQKNPPKFVMQD